MWYHLYQILNSHIYWGYFWNFYTLPIICLSIHELYHIFYYCREGNGTPLQYSCLENSMQKSLEGCSPWGRWGLDTTEQLHFHFSLSCIGEGNGILLQCSCLENPRDGGAWWAAIYGVTQSWTQLKWLSSSSSIIIYFFPAILWYNWHATLCYFKVYKYVGLIYSILQNDNHCNLPSTVSLTHTPFNTCQHVTQLPSPFSSQNV